MANECLSLGFMYNLFLILAPNTSSLQPPAAWSRGKGSDGLAGEGPQALNSHQDAAHPLMPQADLRGPGRLG